MGLRLFLLTSLLIPVFAAPPTLPTGAQPRLIEVDDAGNGYLAGYLAPHPGPDITVTVTDIFVMKYRLDTGAAVYFKTLADVASTNLGAIAVDHTGALYITGNARATARLDDTAFRFVPSGSETGITQLAGGVFIAKINPAGDVAYATLIDGWFGSDIAVNRAGEAYITGDVLQGQLTPTSGAAVARTDAPRTGFVAKLNAAGGKLLLIERGIGGLQIALDGAQNIYVAGTSGGTIDPPITPGAFQATHTFMRCGGTGILGFSCQYAHVAKLNPTGATLLYSTFVTGTYGSFPRALAVDAEGNAFIAGATGSNDYPVTDGVIGPTYRPGPPPNPQTTPQPVTVPPANTGFVTKLNSTGTGLIFSTFFGGSVTDEIVDLRLYNNWIYLSGSMGSEDIQGGGAAVQQCLPRGFGVRMNADGKSLSGDAHVLAKDAARIAIEPNGAVHTLDFSDSDLDSPPADVTCIIDAASLTEVSTIAPGQLLSILGPNLAPETALADVNPGASLPTRLAEVGATVNGLDARLLYVSPRQINLVVPYSLRSSTALLCSSIPAFAPSLRLARCYTPLGVTPRAPATFQAFEPTTDYCGGGLIAFAGPTTLVRNEDGSINRCATPAKPGSIVTIYINGGGSPNASVDESQIAQQKTPVSVPVIALDGTQSLEVRNVSLEPGAPVGVWRVDFRLGNDTGPRQLDVIVDGLPIAQKRLFLFVR